MDRRFFAGNDGFPLPNDRWAWRVLKGKNIAFTALLTVWNWVSRRRVTSPRSQVDVSLTTYGGRTNGVFLTVESIGLGKLRPRKLILWIDEPEVLAHPPRQLQRLMKRGLEIRACDNLGPHKKYYPYTQEFAEDRKLLVTADDDVFYPRWWLRRLVNSYCSNPGDVVAYRVWQVARTSTGFAPYSQWRLCTTTESAYDHFATGVSGVLYDQKMVELLRRSTGFTQVCPRADDIWLHFVATSAGIRVRQVSAAPAEFWPRLRTVESGLAHENTTGGNDAALAATARLFADHADMTQL